MATRPFLKPFAVISSGDLSGNVTSSVTAINELTYLSYTIVWTGTPTGEFFVEVSNDYIPANYGSAPPNSGTWVPVTLTTQILAAGSADSAFVDVGGISAAWIRLRYARTSGSGTANATICGKVA